MAATYENLEARIAALEAESARGRQYLPEGRLGGADLALSLIYTDLRDIRRDLDRRFDAVAAAFKAVDHRLGTIDDRLDAVERRFDAIDDRFDAVERTLATILDRLPR